MRSEHTFTTIASELPVICRQLESTDPSVRAAALHRLHDFAEMTAPWRAMARRTTHRSLLRAGATFAAFSLKHDD